MIKKIRLMLLSLSTLLSFGAPALATVAVSAQAPIDQNNINQSLCSGSNGDFTGGNNGNCNSDAETDGNKLLTTVINVISIIVGVVAVIMIIFGGFRYITSGGKQ